MRTRSVPWWIGRRYATLNTSRLFVGFISRLSVIGLALGVGILITVLSIMNGFDRELREKILALLPHMSVTTLPTYPLMNEAAWQEYGRTLEQHPAITGMAPVVELQGMLMVNGRNKGIMLSGIDPVKEQQASIINQFMRAGTMDSLQAGSYHIVLGETLARHLALSVGDQVTLVSTEVPVSILGGHPRRKNFTVTGLFRVGSQLDATLAYVHMNDAQTLYRLGEGIHGLRLQVNDLFAVSDIGRDIRPLLPETSTLSFWTYEFGSIYQNIQLSKSLVGLLLFLLVAVAAFNVVVSLVMVVRDKQGDIAILRTMGTSMGTIRRIFMVQGTLIGLSGTLIGLVLGIVFSLTITDIVAGIEHLLGIELLSAEVYPVNYMPSQLLWSDVVLVCSISMLLSVLATLYPAFRAAKTRPAETLRFE